MQFLSWRRLSMLALYGVLCAVGAHAEPSHEPTAGRQPSTEASAAAAAVRPALPTQPLRTVVAPLQVKSSSVLVMDALDSSVLYAKQAKRAMPIASITKLMTALVVLESGQSLDEPIQITPADCRLGKGVASRLAVGTQLTRGELLQLALMSSENRAAQALGRAHPGGLPAFVRAMNAKAQALGMKSARFADPTGLSSLNVANATDLVKLVVAAADHPQIRQFSTSGSYAVAVRKQLIEFRNTNTLTAKPDWNILVQKTGYTRDAGQCLVMQAVIRERPVVMVLLNSVGKYTRVADARRIRNWMEASVAEPQLAQAAQ